MNKYLNLFKKDSTTVADLKKAGIKLKDNSSKYNKNSVYFDIETTADSIYFLNNGVSSGDFINNLLMSCKTIGRDNIFDILPYKDNFNYLEILSNIIKPVDIRVRVFGGAKNEDTAKVFYSFQYIDLESDVLKIWNNYISDKFINITEDNFTFEMKYILKQCMPIKVKQNKVIGTIFYFANNIINNDLRSTLNINSIYNTEKGTVIYSNNNKCTLNVNFITPYVVNIWTTANNTGIKGESDKVMFSIYDTVNKYYYKKELLFNKE